VGFRDSSPDQLCRVRIIDGTGQPVASPTVEEFYSGTVRVYAWESAGDHLCGLKDLNVIRRWTRAIGDCVDVAGVSNGGGSPMRLVSKPSPAGETRFPLRSVPIDDARFRGGRRSCRLRSDLVDIL
jgi:hypothetical protein